MHCALVDEKAVVTTAKGLPDGYSFKLASRVRLATAVVRFLATLAAQPISDIEVADAWQELKDAGGENNVTPDQQGKGKEATQRANIIRPIRDLAKRPLSPETDRQMVRLWQPTLLNDSHDAKPYVAMVDEADKRLPLFNSLEAAIKTVDAA